VIKIAKKRNRNIETYYSLGLSFKQLEMLEEQAIKQDISIAKLIRRKLFPKN